MARSWLVFEPQDAAPETLAAADKAVFIKDGFSIGAFLIAPVWLLWRRMWLVFIAWLVVYIALDRLGAVFHVGDILMSVLTLVLALGFALEANQLRAWTLRGKGWRFAGVACGNSRVEAEYRHFEGRNFDIAPAVPLAVNQPVGNENVSRDFFNAPWGQPS
jgi:Protein of unknown function (DUF2628)